MYCTLFNLCKIASPWQKLAIKKHKKDELKSIVVHDLNDSVFSTKGSQRHWFYSRFSCSVKWTCTFLLFSWQCLVHQSFHTYTEPLVNRLSTQKPMSLANCIAVEMQRREYRYGTQLWNRKEMELRWRSDAQRWERTGEAQTSKAEVRKNLEKKTVLHLCNL